MSESDSKEPTYATSDISFSTSTRTVQRKYKMKEIYHESDTDFQTLKFLKEGHEQIKRMHEERERSISDQ